MSSERTRLSIEAMRAEEIQALSAYELAHMLSECIQVLPTLADALIAARKLVSAAKIVKISGGGEAELVNAAAAYEAIKDNIRMVRDIKSCLQSLIRSVP